MQGLYTTSSFKGPSQKKTRPVRKGAKRLLSIPQLLTTKPRAA